MLSRGIDSRFVPRSAAGGMSAGGGGDELRVAWVLRDGKLIRSTASVNAKRSSNRDRR